MDVQLEFVWKNVSDSLKEEVVSFWLSENALQEEEARKRAEQLLIVAKSEGKVIGVSTVVKRLYEPIGKNFWIFRAYVSEKYRKQGVVLKLVAEAKEKLNESFNNGNDTDVIGILLKVQSPILMKHFPQATWPRTQFVYVGMEEGCHMRISYFDEAKIL